MNTVLSLYPGDHAVALALGVVVQVAVVVLAAWIVARALCRRNPAAARGVWHVALVCVLLAPLTAWTLDRLDVAWLRLPVFTAETEAPRASDAGGARAIPQPQIATAEPPSVLVGDGLGTSFTASVAVEPAVEAPGLFRRAVVFGGFVWLAGLVFFVARLVWGWRALVRLRGSFTPIAEPDLGTAGDAARRSLGLARLPDVVRSPLVRSPVSLGIVRPVVVLPENAVNELSPEQLRDVLIHECAHILHRDHAMGLLERIAQALYWVHPAIYVLEGELAGAREELCDNHVLCGSNARRYAQTLLDLAQQSEASRSAALVIGILHPRRLEQRIAGLFDRRRKPVVRASRATLVVTSVMILVAALLVGGIRLVAAGATSTAPVAEGARPAMAAPRPANSPPSPSAETYLALHAIAGYSSLAAEHVRAELKLDSAQLHQLGRIADEFSEQAQADSEGLAGLSHSQRQQYYAELRSRTRERAERAEQAIQQVLTPGQQTTLEVVNLRQGGGAALANQRVLEALGVSRRQRYELRSNRERVAEQMLRLRKDSFDEALGVLTPEQIEKLKKLHAQGYRVDTLATNRTNPPHHGG